ncbi:hypothetical protein P5673_021264 [Acropora cervicornis]|uniref:Uncharacterized protein n=1 Tax=Acropora cervicornis TaxID=6130 RepID=A0AAD9V0I1_ACRCE|nr:hypothetical protein P5673_021264 [Acropora cervicornis]
MTGNGKVKNEVFDVLKRPLPYPWVKLDTFKEGVAHTGTRIAQFKVQHLSSSIYNICPLRYRYISIYEFQILTGNFRAINGHFERLYKGMNDTETFSRNKG